ncbi:nucleotidyl transferase AbiEii/AbiGii toxin family protein [Sorangium sp. So ce1335]|uniref:nucleotidyl transferase AbiEii/AbiGii toxin family protein n=1 Tax=Sorangium sp. So ce1335 TaxID=3133335 RepID=UPI003F624033
MGKFTGLAKEQRRALDRLKSVSGIERFYLAGGTAVAVHLRHRRSLDLDLFSMSADIDLMMLAQAVRVVVPDLQVISMTDAALRIRVGDVPVDIVRYPHRLLEAPEPGPEAFPVAGVRDLAAMKLAAIARRGLRRDFWDLYALAEERLPLRDAAAAYVAKFGVSEADMYHVLRSLTYFEDAEKDPVYPRGLTSTRWERMKRFFLEEAPELLMDERK